MSMGGLLSATTDTEARMLVTFTFSNFKSFKDAELQLGPLTVLIGANAAGKSNAIEALRLLSWLAQGQKLSSIQYAVNSADRVVRGRIDDLCHRGESEFGLGCVTDDDPVVAGRRQLALLVQRDQPPRRLTPRVTA